MTATMRTVLEKDDWFSRLEVEARDALMEAARFKRLPAGRRVYATGDEPNGLWAVLEGQVRLVGYPAEGIEITTLILPAVTWFGELSTFDGRPRPHDAVAFGSATVLNVPMESFVRIATRHPLLYRDVGLLVCAHQRMALEYIAQRLSQPIPGRVARTLLMQWRAAGGGDLQMRQEELASLAGMSRQTLNRTLRALERDGLVALGYARIAILDPGRLEAMVIL